MEFIQIKESCLYIQNLERTQEFYHGQLRLEIISKVENRHIFFRVGTSVLLCFIAEATKNEQNLPAHFAKGKQHLAFEVSVAEYHSVKREIEKSGIMITHIEGWRDGLQSFYFDDPDGHVLEIVPQGIWD